MKAIMVMFDSLNRHMLPPYGCEWTHAPNFERLAKRTVTFDTCYVGSMPCIPARRELHTGRYNFLHRSWGPLEPFDDSMPALLSANGVYTHLVSDHGHYWQDGGATYHTRYNTWEIIRGQEGDAWKGHVADPDIPPVVVKREHGSLWRQDWINRSYLPTEEQHPQHLTFERGLEFIQTNHDSDNWFLQIETFDPHEPYFSPERYKALYPHQYDGPHFDWPPYERVTQTPEQVEHVRYEYAALLSMCDASLGKVLDLMDELALWDDTLLIVNTDHGFLLGEHDWWAKVMQPFYNEIAHIPLFIWDPRTGIRDERRKSLVQTIDLPATLLEFFGVERPPDMQGQPLRQVIRDDAPVRQAGLFGIHGGHVNCTDGRYVYMRGSATEENAPLYEYTLMPTHMDHMFNIDELRDTGLAQPFVFSKHVPLLRIPARPGFNPSAFGTLLFDIQHDPKQARCLQNPEVEHSMIRQLIRLMRENDAPVEQFKRLGLED